MIAFRGHSIYKELPYNSMKKQYFRNHFWKYKEDEVYIDCGAYDGDSVLDFKRHMKRTGGGYSKIVAFEPDETNYHNLVRNHSDVKAVKAGVWNRDELLLLKKDGSGSNFLEAEKSCCVGVGGEVVEVPVKCIDNVEDCKDATFIKMDVEGSEYNALLGAKNTICANRPKLAICIYHSDEDMLRLIELIHEMVPEYYLYVRQHSNSCGETVLYAAP